MGRYRKPFTLFKRGKYWYYKTYNQKGYRTYGKTTGQASKKLAEDYCYELLKMNRLGFSSMTLKDYAENFFNDDSPFLEDRERPLAPSTIRQHRQYLRLHIMPAFGATELNDITFSALKIFRQNLLKEGLKANTINGIFQTFNQILKYAFLDGKIQKNPLQGFGALTRPKNRDGFTRAEIIRLCNLTPKELKDFIILLALTGLRFSECYGLTETDIKTDKDIYYIDLQRQLTDIGYYTDLKTKTKRIIPIVEDSLPLIHAQSVNHSYIKNHMKPIIRTFENWEERKLCIHSIRHFFISDTKAKGLNPLFIESVAGHSLGSIESVYTHFKATDLKQIIEWQKKLLSEIDNQVVYI